MTAFGLSRVQIFADGADLEGIIALASQPEISGFTTNPTLMRLSGVSDYEGFARKVLETVKDLPFSFEVFADDLPEMERQARLIASWGENVFVKIPITNTHRQSTRDVIAHLSGEGVQLNVTALMTLEQVAEVTDALVDGTDSIISVFAGRIADTGRDPMPVMAKALSIMQNRPSAKLLWASPREILNVRQADDLGVHIITVTHEMLKKLSSFGRDLDDFSLDTVKMFHNDAVTAGFQL